jgi:O-antigen/teichoic acid export membrane protein
LIYGSTFAPAASIAVPLIGAAMGMIVVSVAASILAAAEHMTQASWLVSPVTAAGVGLLWFVVPRYGAQGTAVVIAFSPLSCGALLIEAVRRCWQMFPPVGTCVRAATIGAVTFAASLAWPAYGAWLAGKAAVFIGGIVAAFAALGEFDAGDVRYARSVFGAAPREEPAT